MNPPTPVIRRHQDGYRCLRAYRVGARPGQPRHWGPIVHYAGWERQHGRLRRVRTFTTERDATAWLFRRPDPAPPPPEDHAMHAFTFDPEALLGLLPLVAPVRERGPACALTGVALRPDGVALATNGFALAARRHAHTSPVPRVLAVHDATLAAFLRLARTVGKTATRTGTATPVLATPDADGRSLVLTQPGNARTLHVPLLDTPFPDVRPILPSARETAAIQEVRVSARALARFGRDTLRCTFTGPYRAILLTDDLDPDWAGLLMPCRAAHGDAPRETTLAWLRRDPLPEEAAP